MLRELSVNMGSGVTPIRELVMARLQILSCFIGLATHPVSSTVDSIMDGRSLGDDDFPWGSVILRTVNLVQQWVT